MTRDGARRGLLDRLALGRPEARAWALYDFANSAFFTTMVASVFPVWFRSVAADGDEAAMENYALATSLFMLLAALLSPVLGAIADGAGAKKRMLGGAVAIGVAATAGLFFVERGEWVLAAVLFGTANVGVAASLVFYDALLPSVAGPGELDRLSTSAYGLGYLGGGGLLLVQVALLQRPEWFGLADADPTLPARLCFLSVAVWWALFSVPLFLRVREPTVPGRLGLGGAIVGGVRRLRSTFSELRRYREAFSFLIAFLVYNDGVGTIIRMAAAYGDEIGIGRGDLIGAILLVQFIGIPFALLFGRVAARIGAKRAIFVTIAAYFVICLLAWRMTTATEFYAIAVLVGMVQGGCQALSRSLFASMIPLDRTGEFFGLFGVLEKFAGVAGPAVFFAVIRATGSSRVGILSILAFFAVGAWLLARVDVEAGRRAVRR